MSSSYIILQTEISAPAHASNILQQILQDDGDPGFVAAQLWLPAPVWLLGQD